MVDSSYDPPIGTLDVKHAGDPASSYAAAAAAAVADDDDRWSAR